MQEDKSDEELMLAYQLGDESAFEKLYQRHSKRLFGFLKSKVREEAQALDLFQSTFLKLHHFRDHYDTRYPFLPWLFTVCRSVMIDAHRKHGRRKEELMAQVPDLVWLHEPPKTEMGDEVMTNHLEQLPIKQKEALRLRYENDFSFEEIAARLNTGPANARKLVSRAIQFLRRKNEKS